MSAYKMQCDKLFWAQWALIAVAVLWASGIVYVIIDGNNAPPECCACEVRK